MERSITIQTNLSRSIKLGLTAVGCFVVCLILFKSIKLLIGLFLVLGVFMQFLNSKQLFSIIIDRDLVTFNFLQFRKLSKTYARNSLIMKKVKEVHFRGGSNNIFRIIEKSTGKKLFELSCRSFKNKSDVFVFEEEFGNNGPNDNLDPVK